MYSTKNATKYILNDFKKGMLIFYTVILAITLIMMFSYFKFSNPNNQISFGGFGFSTVIFLFVSGLNSFKTNFKFMQANNVPRKRLYTSTIVSFLLVAGFMALIDVALNRVLNQIFPYEGLVDAIYHNNFFLAEFIWSFSLFTVALSGGWLITMIYYRCNKIMKIIISVAPVFLIVLLGYINSFTRGAVVSFINTFMVTLFDLTNLNPFVSAFNIFILTAVVLGLCYLLIRRAPIKE